jgi:hypothetical protein
MGWAIRRIVARMELTDQRLDQRLEQFTPADATARELITGISRAFARGYNDALRSFDPAAVRAYADAQDDDYLTPFYVEGASMALAAGRALHPLRARGVHRRLLAELREHDYLIFVGWGWWYAVRPAGAAGLRRSPVWGTGDLFSSLVVDGMAFAACFLKAAPPHYDVTCPFRDPDHRRVWAQGYGRALWFAAGGRPEAILRQYERLDPELRPELHAGLGLATAFAGLRHLDVVPPAPAAMSPLPDPAAAEDDERAFYQGMAFGLTARRQASPRSYQRFVDRLDEPTARWVADVTDRCLDPPPVEGGAVATYVEWQRKLRQETLISELLA